MGDEQATGEKLQEEHGPEIAKGKSSRGADSRLSYASDKNSLVKGE